MNATELRIYLDDLCNPANPVPTMAQVQEATNAFSALWDSLDEGYRQTLMDRHDSAYSRLRLNAALKVEPIEPEDGQWIDELLQNS